MDKKTMKKIMINGIDMFTSLNKACKDSGSGSFSLNELNNMSVLDLFADIAALNIRFFYVDPTKYDEDDSDDNDNDDSYGLEDEPWEDDIKIPRFWYELNSMDPDKLNALANKLKIKIYPIADNEDAKAVQEEIAKELGIAKPIKRKKLNKKRSQNVD